MLLGGCGGAGQVRLSAAGLAPGKPWDRLELLAVQALFPWEIALLGITASKGKS